MKDLDRVSTTKLVDELIRRSKASSSALCLRDPALEPDIRIFNHCDAHEETTLLAISDLLRADALDGVRWQLLGKTETGR